MRLTPQLEPAGSVTSQWHASYSWTETSRVCNKPVTCPLLLNWSRQSCNKPVTCPLLLSWSKHGLYRAETCPLLLNLSLTPQLEETRSVIIQWHASYSWTGACRVCNKPVKCILLLNWSQWNAFYSSTEASRVCNKPVTCPLLLNWSRQSCNKPVTCPLLLSWSKHGLYRRDMPLTPQLVSYSSTGGNKVCNNPVTCVLLLNWSK